MFVVCWLRHQPVLSCGVGVEHESTCPVEPSRAREYFWRKRNRRQLASNASGRRERAVCRMQGKKLPRKSHLKTSVRSPAWPNIVLPQKDMKIYFITEFLTRACSFLREYRSSVLRNSPRTLSQTHKLSQVCSRQKPSNTAQSWFAFPVAGILVLFGMLKVIPLAYRTQGSQRDWHVMDSRQTSHLASQDLRFSFPTHSPGWQLPAPRFCPAPLERTQKCRSAQTPAASQG